jgi:hypothetical protein
VQGGLFLRKTPLGFQVSVMSRIENAIVGSLFAAPVCLAVQVRYSILAASFFAARVDRHRSLYLY